MIKLHDKELTIGDSFTFIRKFSDNDVLAFAEVSQDFNPIHLDEIAAKKSIFKQRVVHGALVASVFSMIYGTQFPGEGTIYAKEQISYRNPVFLNTEITFKVTLKSIDLSRKSMIMDMIAYDKEKTYAIGEALLYHFGIGEY